MIFLFSSPVSVNTRAVKLITISSKHSADAHLMISDTYMHAVKLPSYDNTYSDIHRQQLSKKPIHFWPHLILSKKCPSPAQELQKYTKKYCWRFLETGMNICMLF